MASSKLSKNRRTDTQKKRLADQPFRTTANKARKLAKHVRAHPNDQQAAQGKDYTPPAKTRREPITEEFHRPPRFNQTNEGHLGLVRISAATLLKMNEYKNILLGSKQSLAEANQQFSTDPLK